MISSNSEHRNPNNGDESQPYFDDFESACSTPYVSAPSSPGRGSSGSISTSAAVSGGFFYSAPASPIHFAFSQNSFMNSASSSKDDNSVPMGFEFEFSARFGSNGPVQPGSMSSADELFLNGKIRPMMKLSSHLERPQALTPLIDLVEIDDGDDGESDGVRGRDPRAAKSSVRRRTRSMSPMRSSTGWIDRKGGERNDNDTIKEENDDEDEEDESNPRGLKLTANPSTSSSSASSSRSSSAGRNSKRWLFLKEFLRSKSEGSSNSKRLWSHISFSPASAAAAREKKAPPSVAAAATKAGPGAARVKPANGVVEKKNGKKKTYELHYTANRAQAEEMRKKTYLPYRQGLLGCLGFSSKGYGAVNGLARALNPVSSR